MVRVRYQLLITKRVKRKGLFYTVNDFVQNISSHGYKFS